MFTELVREAATSANLATVVPTKKNRLGGAKPIS